jgi:hypothetical protein
MMRHLQITIESELDDALNHLSAEEGVSKAALIRRFVRSALQPLPRLAADPLSSMAGVDDFDPTPADDVVYR